MIATKKMANIIPPNDGWKSCCKLKDKRDRDEQKMERDSITCVSSPGVWDI